MLGGHNGDSVVTWYDADQDEDGGLLDCLGAFGMDTKYIIRKSCCGRRDVRVDKKVPEADA